MPVFQQHQWSELQYKYLLRVRTLLKTLKTQLSVVAALFVPLEPPHVTHRLHVLSGYSRQPLYAEICKVSDRVLPNIESVIISWKEKQI